MLQFQFFHSLKFYYLKNDYKKIEDKKMPNLKKFLKNYKSVCRFDSIIWLLIPVCLSPLSTAHAYIDAGTGSYIIQVTIGAIFAGAYAFRGFFSTLIGKLKKQPKKTEVSSNKKNNSRN